MSESTDMPLDLRFRISNDGGPLWRLLSPISATAMKNERVRLLAFAGALVDSGRITVQMQAPILGGQVTVDTSDEGKQADLRLRIGNECGVLYQILASLPPGPARITRLKGLANIGALFEIATPLPAGIFQQGSQTVGSAANADSFSKATVKARRKHGAGR